MSTTEISYMTSAELSARRDQLVSEARELASTGEALTGSDLERFEAIEREIDQIRERRELIERIASAGPHNQVEAYQDSPAQRRTESAPQGHREAALRTIEAYSDVAAEASSAHLEHIVRRRDPRGIVARYLTAVGSEDYERAFSKVLLDPQTGHLKLTPAEVASFQRVQEVEQERALVTSTTGIPIPYQLDPTLIYAGSGASTRFGRSAAWRRSPRGRGRESTPPT